MLRPGLKATLAVLLVASLVGGSWAVVTRDRARLRSAGGPHRPLSENLNRFAAVSFGDGADHALKGKSEVTSERAGIHPPGVEPIAEDEYRTPNGWLLRPAGEQLITNRAPTGVAVSPDNQTIFVINSSVFEEALVAFDATTFARTAVPVGDLYLGVTSDADGNVWAAGGNRNRVFQFKYEGPVAAGTRHLGPFPGTPNNGLPATGFPGNMVLSDDGRLFVAGNLSVPSEAIIQADPEAAPCAKSKICSVVNVYDVSNPDNPQAVAPHLVPVGRDAYGVALNEQAGKLYVSNWADETNPVRARGRGTVSVVDVKTPGGEREVQVVAVGHHPTGIALSPDGRTLAVTNSADDSVSLLTLGASGLVTHTRTVSVETTPGAPRGATPLAVSYSLDGELMFVVLAGQNAIEVRTAGGYPITRNLEIGSGANAETHSVPHTYIPTGWYPSAIVVAPHPSDAATRLYVTNLKGNGAGPGLNGQAEPLSGSRTQGTMSAIDIPDDGLAAADLFDEWTATTVENNRWTPLFDPRVRDAAANPCLPAPLPGGGSVLSPLLCNASRGKIDSRPLHVLYIIKENKTFDQYFGDINATIPDADADPTWLLYGEEVTTNQHNLARLFSLSDNFWADSEASTTGHSWTSAGYATEFIEITWNQEYSLGFRGNRGGGDYGGGSDEEIAEQEGELFEPEERLVDIFADRRRNPLGLTYRIYSDDVNRDSPAIKWRVPLGMWGLGADATHRGRDLDFPDTDRARLFLYGITTSNAWSGDQGGPPSSFGQSIEFTEAEKKKFVLGSWVEQYERCMEAGGRDAQCQRAMPNFTYMVLPVDHTLGFNPFSPTPASMVADNDYAVGLIVDALSKSPFWKNTLIMITEDDTQAAGDHVDAHRTFLLTTGGLARRHGPDGSASHQAGSFPSILKTIEVLFGMEPLTIYDRAAIPLHDVVVAALADANTETYDAVKPVTPFLRNPETGPFAELSMMLDWRIDRTDPYFLRDLLYAGLKGWPLPAHYYDLLEE